MLTAGLVTTDNELVQIHQLNTRNLKANLSDAEKEKEGYVSWLYSIELLQQMHRLAPSVIVKDGATVAGYALATLREAASFHSDLQAMLHNLASLQYNGKTLDTYRHYFMGQICIDKPYRGKGIFQQLYLKHKEIYSAQFDLLVTEVATGNIRSLKAHLNIGFKIIHTYTDVMDEWHVVVWDWRQ